MRYLIISAALFTVVAFPLKADPELDAQMETNVLRAGYNLGYMGRFAMDCPFRVDFENHARAYLNKVDARFGVPSGDESLSQRYRNAYNNGFELADENLSDPNANVNCQIVEQSFRQLVR